MIDQRFFNKKPFITMKRICELLSIELPNNASASKRITNIETIENATSSNITFFHNSKYANEMKKTKAYACVVNKDHAHLVPSSTISLIVDEPYLAHALLLKELYSLKTDRKETFISKKAVVSKKAVIEEGCYISDFVTISDGVIIKRDTFIGSNVTILDGVEIGENSYIESNVTIGYAIVGASAYIKSGARIGQQGFGFHVGKTGITDVLQIGRVIIGEDVQIGANCTIDRGSMNDTKIGSHSRLDNMIHIAHNVEIGEYCVIAAQTGIAGSTKIGNQCFLGGQIGIAGHLEIGDNVVIAAQSGIMKNTPSGSKIAGTPATNIINWHRQTIALKKLVEFITKFQKKGFWNKIKALLSYI